MVIKGKGKILLVQASKEYRRNRVVVSLICNLGTRHKRVINLVSQPFYPRERHHCTI
jgi:hypothetical protein